MKINILSIFPDLFTSFLDTGIVRKSYNKNLLDIEVTNIRDFASDSYGTVDDYPYGGGAGMIMMVEPIVAALESIENSGEVYLLTPRGKLFNQTLARELSNKKTITLICGRYKGVDERVRDFIDGEISIGDFILSGGEVAAMAIVESIARLLPGAVSDVNSIRSDSFENGLLDSPNYTRPKIFRGREVPLILLSGNHEEIKKWRKKEAYKLTKRYRADLLAQK
jgi:tRNA (guanine37-N1)-methyltransferase